MRGTNQNLLYGKRRPAGVKPPKVSGVDTPYLFRGKELQAAIDALYQLKDDVVLSLRRIDDHSVLASALEEILYTCNSDDQRQLADPIIDKLCEVSQNHHHQQFWIMDPKEQINVILETVYQLTTEAGL
jgi:hypothetical protein